LAGGVKLEDLLLDAAGAGVGAVAGAAGAAAAGGGLFVLLLAVLAGVEVLVALAPPLELLPASVAYHSLTPLWPRQAPCLWADCEYVPSLQMPLVPAGASAGACARLTLAQHSAAANRPMLKTDFMRNSP
jgi:hypothetical protein